MADSAPNRLKLRLKKTETNRLKTETSRHRTSGADDAAAGAEPPPPEGDPGNTAQIADPMAMRDTSTGKLRRIQSSEESATALAPGGAAGTGPKRSETVRLKVVRNKREDLPNVVGEGQAGPPAPAGDTIAVTPPSPLGTTGSPNIKKSTSTIKVEHAEPAEPAEPADTATEGSALDDTKENKTYSDTGTSTIKLQIKKPSRPKVITAAPSADKASTSTLRIRPPSTPAAAPAEAPSAAKEATSTLKIKPSSIQVSQTPADDEPAVKSATTTLRTRRGPQAAAAAPVDGTVKIKPPAAASAATKAAVSPDEETQIGIRPPQPAAAAGPKPTLRLHKQDESTRPPVALPPTLAERDAEETSDSATTVAVSPEDVDSDASAKSTIAVAAPGPSGGPKRDLKLRGKKAAEMHPDGEDADDDDLDDEDLDDDAQAIALPRTVAVSTGPSSIAAAAALVAVLGAAALVFRLTMDFLSYR